MIAYIYIYINISYIYIYTHILATFLCIATFVMFIYFLKTVQSFPIIYLGNHLLKKASQLNDLWWVILGWFGAHFGVLLRSVKSFLINICKDVSWDRLVLFEICTFIHDNTLMVVRLKIFIACITLCLGLFRICFFFPRGGDGAHF